METKKLKFSVIMLSVVVVVLMGIAISVAEAQGERGGAPVFPCTFYGNVTIDGKSAPVGTEITAKMDNKTCENITVKEKGRYGGPGKFDPKLVVSGAAEDENKIISFYVNGTKAEEAGTWNSGRVKHLDLSVKKAGSGGNGNEEEGAAASAIPYTVLILLIAIVIVVVAVAVWRRRGR